MSAVIENDDLAARAAAALYGFAVRAHDAAWRSGVRRPWVAPVPVVSVGNLAVGGTGKTPTVIHLAAALLARGWRPAVLSRGHGRKGSGEVVLAPGAPAPTADLAGDEPVEMFEALKGVPILVSADRRRTARRAIAEFGADVLLLDDGFQHRPLARTIDLVLLDAAHPFGNGRLVPAGPLREPPRALSRAGMVLLTRSDHARDLAASRQLVATAAPRAWIGTAVHRATGLVPLPGSVPRAERTRREVVAVAGIARPDTFLAGLRDAGLTTVDTFVFGDHHRFDAGDYRRVRASAGEKEIVTTAKDAVRWRQVPGFDPAGWWILAVRLEPDPGFLPEIERRLAAAGHRPRAGTRPIVQPTATK